ncbi:MAG: copper chaperone PCu(A)C [Kiloniellaceae bacterium]
MISILSRFSAAALAAMLFTSLPATAHEYQLGDLTIGHPWARASAGLARNGAAYLTLHNAGATGDRLVAASSDVAEHIELHTHLMEGDVMKMRRVEAIEVPAGGDVALQPSGLHIMLIGLKAPLVEGERFALTLRFAEAGEIAVEFAVEAVGGMGHGSMNHGSMNHGGMNHDGMNHDGMGHGAPAPAN